MQKVKQLLSGKGSEVFSIDPDEIVLSAIRMMAERHVGALLVMKGPDLLGIISERDYARKVYLKGHSSRNTLVREIMTSSLISVTLEDTIEHCMHLCTEKRIRHLPVLDSGRVIGVISIGDLVKAVIADQEQKIEHLQQYIQG